MPASLVALFGAALCQATSADQSDLGETLSLLARAANGRALVLTLQEGNLILDQETIPARLPGATVIAEALALHHTRELHLPAGLLPKHWAHLVQCFANPVPLDHDSFLQHLRNAIPALELWSEVRDSTPVRLTNQSHRLAADLPTHFPPIIDSAAQPPTLLIDLVQQGREAFSQREVTRAAQALLALSELEQQGDPIVVAMVHQERRRVATPGNLEWLVPQVFHHPTSELVARALLTLGSDATEPLLSEIGAAVRPGDREILISILSQIPDYEAQVISALRGSLLVAQRGAALTAGRQRLVRTVPALANLLRHADAELRPVAWHALSEIGTPEAVEALNPQRR